MAHELEQLEDGTTAFVSRRIPGWHRLGQVEDVELLTADAALSAGKLKGWDVQTFPLIAGTHQQGGWQTVQGRVATVRRNPLDPTRSDVLGIVSDEYQVIQNEEAFAFLDALVDDGLASYETAGSLRGGRQVFVTMRLPEAMKVGGADVVDWYIACMTSHDGSMAFTVLPTPVRVVCANTQSAALQGAQSLYRVLHTSGALPRVQDARDALALSYSTRDSWGAAMERLLDTEMDARAFSTFVAEHVVPMPDPAGPEGQQPARRVEERVLRQRSELDALFRQAETQDFGRWTRYGAFNTVAEWSEWVRPKTLDERSTVSTLMGATAQLRSNVAQLLLK